MSRLSKRMRLILVTLSFVIVVAFVGVTWGIESVDAAKKITDSNNFLNRSLQGTGVPRSDVRDYIGVVIETALGIVSLLFLILMVYAGFTWMTARGEQDKIDKAKKTIIAAIIGLALIVGGYAITRLVVGTIGGGGAVQEGCDRFHVDEQACNDQDLCAYNTIKTRCEVKVDAGVPSGDSCDQLEDEQTCENQEGCVFIFGTCTSSEF